MAKHAGKDMLIYLGDRASPGVFSLIVGLRSCSLSGSGLLQRQDSHQACLQVAMDGSIGNYRIAFADTGISLTGPFLLTTFEGPGEYTDAQQYSIFLESAGDIRLVWGS